MIEASNLYQPRFWAEPLQVYKLFQTMRKAVSIQHCSCDGYPDLWHITRYSDLIAIESAPDIFNSSTRMRIKSHKLERAVRNFTGGRPYMIRGLTAMDAPEHSLMRAVVHQHFSPKNVNNLRLSIQEAAYNSIHLAKGIGDYLDFAKEIAFQFPLRIIMPMLGVPQNDYQFILELTKQLFGPSDPDHRRSSSKSKTDSAEDVKDVYHDLHHYFLNLIKSKSQDPSTDLISEIAKAMSTVKYMDQDSAIHYCILIATAGHDTTSYSLSEAIYQLALNNELLSRLAENPQGVSPKITEEAIRLAAPTRHFIRTANQDVTISGTTIKSGDSVILWFPSACRDESVVPEPDVLRLDRSHKVPQSAFGSGPHVCLGMHLARLELMCFLQEFAKHVKRVKLLDQPKYTESNFVGGIKSLPIQLEWAQGTLKSS